MKRKTKQQAWDTLYTRVCDIMATACGDDPEGECFTVLACNLPEIVWGLRMRLLPADYEEEQAFLTSMYNAGEYDSARKLTDFLFRHGIRA